MVNIPNAFAPMLLTFLAVLYMATLIFVGWIFSQRRRKRKPDHKAAVTLTVAFGPTVSLTHPEVTQMAYQLSLDNKVPIASVTGVDRKGNPAPLENISFASSDVAVAEVVETEGVFYVIPNAAGACQLQVTADARIGEEEKLIHGLVDLEVLPGEAVAVNVNFGEPVPVE